jgi:hypothetical protein
VQKSSHLIHYADEFPLLRGDCEGYRQYAAPTHGQPVIQVHHSPQIFLFASSLLLHHFFIFPSASLTYHEQLTLYTTTLIDEHKVTLSYTPACPSLSYHD